MKSGSGKSDTSSSVDNLDFSIPPGSPRASCARLTPPASPRSTPSEPEGAIPHQAPAPQEETALVHLRLGRNPEVAARYRHPCLCRTDGEASSAIDQGLQLRDTGDAWLAQIARFVASVLISEVLTQHLPTRSVATKLLLLLLLPDIDPAMPHHVVRLSYVPGLSQVFLLLQWSGYVKYWCACYLLTKVARIRNKLALTWLRNFPHYFPHYFPCRTFGNFFVTHGV